jgi:NAD(P)-dependent dehydrogenase (short-subunit alcohol dehydrogenase family)
MHELVGRVALVTGGSRGMGREIVLAFAERGAHVAIASRKLENCRALADHVEATYGVRTLAVACNVSYWDQCGELVEAVYDEFGRLDILVNNAGLSPVYPSLEELSESLFDKTIAVNLKGPFRLAVLAGSRMAASSGGSIINVGSVETIRPHARALPYGAAKAGLGVISEGLARAFAPTVRVNTLQPGPFLTDIAANWADGVREEAEAAVALGRCGEPAEIVGAVLFLATSASSYVTGAVLRVDGGWR